MTAAIKGSFSSRQQFVLELVKTLTLLVSCLYLPCVSVMPAEERWGAVNSVLRTERRWPWQVLQMI